MGIWKEGRLGDSVLEGGGIKAYVRLSQKENSWYVELRPSKGSNSYILNISTKEKAKELAEFAISKA